MTLDRILMLIVIGVLLVIILLQIGCISKSKPDKPIPKSDTTTHLSKDSAQLQANVMKVYYPKYIKGKDRIAHDTFFVPAKKLTKSDSNEIIKNYLITRLYRDSICEADVELGILDSVGQNLLLGRTYGIKNLRKTVISIINPPKFKVFLGFNLGLSTDLNHFIAGPKLTFLTKSDQMYNLEFSFPQKVVSLGIGWKIHF